MLFPIKINDTIINISNNIRTIKNREKLKNFKQKNNELFWSYNCLIIKDNVEIEDSFIKIKREIKVLKTNRYKIELIINHDVVNYEIFIPSVIYKGNLEGKGKFPRLKDEKYWSFDESRMTIPGCIEIKGSNKTLILAHRANNKHLATSWTKTSVSFSLPSIEWPYEYTGKNSLEKTIINDENSYTNLDKGTKINQEYIFYINDTKKNDLLGDYKIFLEKFINLTPRVEPKLSFYDFKGLLLKHLLFLVERGKSGHYIKMGKGNEPHQEIYEYTSASFLVKSVEAASILCSIEINNLKDNLSYEIKQILEEQEKITLENLSYKDLAKSIGNYFLQAEKPRGIFRDCQDLKSNIWGGYLGIGENNEFRWNVNSRTNGEALLAYLSLSKYCDPISKKKYLKLIDNIVNFYLEHQLESGNFGRWWSKDGTLIDDKGTNGAYIFLFFIKYYKQTKSEKLLNSIKKAIKYYAKLIETGSYFGDTLDADSCDKEAGQILLSSFLELYDIKEFRTKYILSLCEKSATFIMTWIMADNIVFDPTTPLGERNFKTKGLSVVSIANQHLDLYGMMIAYDFLRLYKYCGGQIYLKLAKNMINSCTQLISKPDDLLGRSKEYIGWIPEQINHTRWDYFNDKAHHNGYFLIDIAWVQVLVLKYLIKIENDFSEVI